eukprot:7381897-Prymnesium_polylepis.1
MACTCGTTAASMLSLVKPAPRWLASWRSHSWPSWHPTCAMCWACSALLVTESCVRGTARTGTQQTVARKSKSNRLDMWGFPTGSVSGVHGRA